MKYWKGGRFWIVTCLSCFLIMGAVFALPHEISYRKERLALTYKNKSRAFKIGDRIKVKTLGEKR